MFLPQGTSTQRIVMTSATLKIPASALNERLNDSSVLGAFDDNTLYSSPLLEYRTSPHPINKNKRALGDYFQRDRGDPSIRLMEGPTPLIGRLQVYHRSQWRSVCTNSRKYAQDNNIIIMLVSIAGHFTLMACQ